MGGGQPRRLRLTRLRLVLGVAICCLAGGYFVGLSSQQALSASSSSKVRGGLCRPGPGRCALHPQAAPAGTELTCAPSSTPGPPQKAPRLHSQRRPSLVYQGGGYAPPRRVCEDSCTGFTRNGVCDEGRPTHWRAMTRNRRKRQYQQDPSAALYTVHCDLGTDCLDCGPWVRRLGARAVLPWCGVPAAASRLPPAPALPCAALQVHTNTDEAVKWKPIKQIRQADPNVSLLRLLHGMAAPSASRTMLPAAALCAFVYF